mmetsp:Transcript_15077/g.29363  ORF Transcript_15077/g.29363 Transcript_15077/m.29363 type:complete len:333 (-) Transcript_15077:69-1067(-)|eukprot:CAMPEP_0171491514 /NCGR_PEP_ID=MMETSP0958-20121227/3900_1 /TAXON_ID=87120 /ORGANISM="Aurantiochytrium limacinum, Strain ATCCMYA-1381" /LENGTH=332 /DNA_ID=CAMNT_0012024937 /DNA_START=269 /DNA_END=1267 /DNA_ORIENTATION=+
MSSVNVTNISVLNNPGKFTDPFRFEVTFECVKELSADLEWRLTYVGSPDSEACDQELESVLVGPVPLGVNRFELVTPPPDHTKIPRDDLLGVTVCLLACLYKDKEFIRIGYYVNNEYDDPDAEKLKPSEDSLGMAIDDSDNEEEEEEEDDDDEEEENDDDDEDGEGDENTKDALNNEGSAKESSSARKKKSSSSSKEQDEDEEDEASGEAADKESASAANDEDGEQDTSGTQDQADAPEEDEGPPTKRVKHAEDNNVEDNDEEEQDAEDDDQQEEEEDDEDDEDGGSKKEDDKEMTTKPESLQLPAKFSVDKIKRSILADKPRITRIMIDWE